jgi:hypothetical protein
MQWPIDILKKRIADFIDYRIDAEFVRRDVEAASRQQVHPVDAIAEDPMAFHQRAAAEALAAGIGLTYGADIAGDVAEFGTMTGFTAKSLARSIALSEAAMQNACSIYGLAPRTLMLFDSFEGLPEITDAADSNSPHVQRGAWSPGACKGLSERDLMALVTSELPAARVKTFPGWFKDTIAAVPANTRFALVHIDCDLYSSTIDVLDGLLRRGFLSEGGLICFDDWNCNRASPEHGERKAWTEMIAEHDIEWSDRGDYGIFGHSVIVHRYRAARGRASTA